MKVIKIHTSDNVAVCLEDLKSGIEINLDEKLAVLENIPKGHKICLSSVSAGENIIKYGFPIGKATKSIEKGEWVHTHNIKTNLSQKLDYRYEPSLAEVKNEKPGQFMGFKRKNGVGIRNEIWIIPTVGCMNSIADIIEKKAQALIKGSIEGIYSFKHPYGCSQLGDDHENTKKALCGLIKHSNAGGVLVLGLGCENNGIEGMKEALGEFDSDRIKFLVSQKCGDEVQEALKIIEELAGVAQLDKREARPVSELVIGLKCGGSDGLSGITANPLTGVFADMLIAEGGSAILTEVPEMFGAETILMNRCVSESIFHKTVSLINDFKDYFLRHGQEVYENPSPGNKEGGITTLEEKSLGCTQKSGSANVVDVLEYGQQLTEKGLNLLCSPGNDLIAATAEAVSGAHIVLFTTGRGTPFGCPVPTVKISSNTALFEKKPNWIDFNAGELVNGQAFPDAARELYNYVVKLASGEILTKTEQNGVRDLAIFKTGVTL